MAGNTGMRSWGGQTRQVSAPAMAAPTRNYGTANTGARSWRRPQLRRRRPSLIDLSPCNCDSRTRRLGNEPPGSFVPAAVLLRKFV